MLLGLQNILCPNKGNRASKQFTIHHRTNIMNTIKYISHAAYVCVLYAAGIKFLNRDSVKGQHLEKQKVSTLRSQSKDKNVHH